MIFDGHSTILREWNDETQHVWYAFDQKPNRTEPNREPKEFAETENRMNLPELNRIEEPRNSL